MVIENEINTLMSEKILRKIDDCVEKAWSETKKDGNYTWWWDEKLLILPFYFHLRPKIEKLNSISKKSYIYIIPEYAPKASSYAKNFGDKFPHLRKGQKEYLRTRKVDLCIVAFDHEDLKQKKTDPKMTYWYVKHVPTVLLEFKILTKKPLVREMKKDLKKLKEIQQKHQGVKRVYFCYLADELLSREEIQIMIRETKVKNLRICYATQDGKDWGAIWARANYPR